VTTNSGRDVLDFNTVTDPVGDNNCGLERVVGFDGFQRKHGEQSRGTSTSCSLHGAVEGATLTIRARMAATPTVLTSRSAIR
jgi:hypothetical protein